MIVAIVAFAISLLGMIVLFSAKYREARTGHIYFPGLREASDEKAIALKARLMQARVVIEHLPPILMILARNLVRVIALKFAAFLRYGEDQAHRLADMVSHKHRFERRETRSEFLKQVADHKNGGGAREISNVGHEHDDIAG